MRRTMILIAFVFLSFGPRAFAADYFWNPGVNGSWVSANWSTPADGPTYATNWADSNTANFTGGGRTITVNSFVTVAGINFTANNITIADGGGTSDLRLVASVPVSVLGTVTATIAETMTSVGAGSALVKQGTGTLVLSGSNNITTVNIADGTLRLGSNTAFGSVSSSPGLVVNGTLDLAGFSASRGALSGSGTITNSVAGASTLTVGTGATGSTSFGGLIQNGTGTVALTKVGTGTLILPGNHTYTGVTTIGGGILSVPTLTNGGTASGIGQSSNATANLVFNGGTLQYTGSGTSTDRAFTLGTGGGTISNTGTGALTWTSNSVIALSGSGDRTLTLAGTNTNGLNRLISGLNDSGGVSSLVKSGSNTWAYNGTSLYSGTTTVSAGGLYFNATKSGAGAITVAAGATLGGAGTVAGAVSLTSATLEIGNGTAGHIDDLALSGPLTFTSSTVRFHFDRTGGERGRVRLRSTAFDVDNQSHRGDALGRRH